MTRRRIVPRLMATVLGTLLLTPLAFSAPASSDPKGKVQGGESVVREVVVSVLDPAGEVRSTHVAQLVRLDDSEVRVPKDDSLEEYRTLSGFSRPSSEGDDYVWSSPGRKDTLALAEISKQLPLEVEITYTLDGKKTTADEIRGENGRVGIDISLRNISSQTKTLTYDAVSSTMETTTVPFYVPLEYSVVATFPSRSWTDLQAPLSYVETDGSGDQIVVRPGILAPPLTNARETISFEAVSEDIALPDIRIVAFPRVNPLATDALDTQFSGLKDLYGGLGSLNSNLNSVYEGTLALLDGVQQMLTGVGERDEATKEPVITLDDAGTPETLVGALGFIRNALRDRLLPGVGERDTSTGKGKVALDADGNPTTLIGALQLMADAVNDDLRPAIGERDPATGRAVEKYFDPKHADSTLLWGLQSSKDAYDNDLIPSMDRLIGGVDQLVAGLRTFDPADPGLVDGLEQVRDGLGALNAKLDTLGTGPGFKENLQQIKDLAALGSAQSGDPLFHFIGLIADGLLQGLGNRNADGSPNIVLDADGNPLTVIGTIGLLQAALGQQILPGIGDVDPDTKQPIVTLDADGNPTTLLGTLGFIRNAALVNPQFTKAQPGLDGMVPKDYYQECPACWDESTPIFDSRTANPAFQPAMRDAFVLFSEGLGSGMEALQTFDEDNPGLVEGLRLIGGGLDRVLAGLHTSNTQNPGLVDGLQQLQGGVEDVVKGLHTFDASDPGLVEGLQLARNGAQQLSQALFAINELGLRTVRGQVGDQGDGVGLDKATLAGQADEYGSHTVVATEADDAFTTYVFEVPGQAGTGRDNAVRGALIGLSVAGLAFVSRRSFGVA